MKDTKKQRIELFKKYKNKKISFDEFKKKDRELMLNWLSLEERDKLKKEKNALEKQKEKFDDNRFNKFNLL